jgi:hypothetical protein
VLLWNAVSELLCGGNLIGLHEPAVPDSFRLADQPEITPFEDIRAFADVVKLPTSRLPARLPLRGSTSASLGTREQPSFYQHVTGKTG